MAKRLVATVAASDRHGSASSLTNTTVGPDVPVCCSASAVDGVDTATSIAIDACVTAVSPPTLETTSTDAESHDTPRSCVTWSYLCPLCGTAELVDPVDLHAPVERCLSPPLASCSTDEPLHCLACRVCAEQWHTATRALCCDGAALSSESAVQCPLCGTSCRDKVSAPLCLCGGGATGPLDADAVRNCYTGPSSTLCGAPCSSSKRGRSRGERPSHLFCGVCEAAKATCVCVQCDFGMCEECHSATHTKGGFRQHEVVSVEQARRRLQVKCSEHPGMALDLYCETCAMCVCVTCCFGGAHRGHEVHPLASVAARTSADLALRSTELGSVRRSADEACAELESLWPAYESTVRDVRADIELCFSTLRRLLQEREDALLHRLGDAVTEVGRRSTAMRNAAAAVSTLLGSAEERVRRLPDSVDAVTLMRVGRAAQDQLERISGISERVVAEATAAVEGWRHRLGSDDPNGCGMASFVLLDAATPNAAALKQYQGVLAGLGQLDTIAELPVATAAGASCTATATEPTVDSGEDGDDGSRHRWGGAVEPESLLTVDEVGDVVGVGRDADSDTRRAAAAADTDEGEEGRLVRPSHMASSAAPLPRRLIPATPSLEVSVATRETEDHAGVRSGSSVPSMHTPSLTVPAQPRHHGTARVGGYAPLRSYELNVGRPDKSLVPPPSSSLLPLWAAQATRTRSVSLTPREADYTGPVCDGGVQGRYGPDDAVAGRSVRDTVPFRVSLPPRRLCTSEHASEERHVICGDGDLPPRRAAKIYPEDVYEASLLRRTSMARRQHQQQHQQQQQSADLEERPAGERAETTLDFRASVPRSGRAEPQRRTTGLQLEL
ncbi:putative tripartite motif protein [Novymonas esmeraldas]|uniref:Tripartite motif protein n=1 Tax=Novymonas esmeraldas TaxID=1808958 RepID=A0AAW0F2J5_9TRYP